MATCKDCINYTKCCNSFLKDFCMVLDPEREICSIFKDRSRFVELPCEVGDTVYILGKEIFCDEIDGISIEKLSDGILCFWAYCKELKISLDLKDFGTIAFLTKEEAEQALKERESNV